MTIRELSQAIADGRYTSEELTRQALNYIRTNDIAGKKLNTVSEIHQNAIFEARARDLEIRRNGLKSPLHGIPILLKDNIDVKGLHTTAGSYALSDLIADRDSTVAAKLREAGAVILGKANLSEFAYWMSTQGMPSGYSSMSGQVVHAYNPAFDPSGSSSGSAVAVSARFVPVSIGSETSGSLMSPGIANGIVSIKPTVGLISRNGILPISHTQDTAGPMANTVEDCAYLLQILAGPDPEDEATLDQELHDYTGALQNDLTGKRIGVYTETKYPLTEKQQEAQEDLKRMIEEAGGTVVPIEYEETSLECMEILTGEFRNGVERYLASHNSRCRTLSDIIDFNARHPERCLKYGQDLLITSDHYTGLLKEASYLKELMDQATESRKRLDQVLQEQNLYALVKASGWASNLAAVRTSCSMVLPARPFNPDTYEPVSYFMMAGPYQEHHLIRLAYTLQQRLGLDTRPAWVGKTIWDA